MTNGVSAAEHLAYVLRDTGLKHSKIIRVRDGESGAFTVARWFRS